MIKSMSPRVEQDYNAMKSSYEAFKSSTDWGKFDATDLIAAVYVWSQDNLVEAFRAGKIGEELWKAGSQGELSKTNPNLSDPRVLHSVESSVFVNDKDLKKLPTKRMLPYVPSAGVLGAYPSSGFRNDPVNIATGNFIEYELDLAFDNTAATALSLERMYNSFTVAHPKILPSGFLGLGGVRRLIPALTSPQKVLSGTPKTVVFYTLAVRVTDMTEPRRSLGGSPKYCLTTNCMSGSRRCGCRQLGRCTTARRDLPKIPMRKQVSHKYVKNLPPRHITGSLKTINTRVTCITRQVHGLVLRTGT